MNNQTTQKKKNLIKYLLLGLIVGLIVRYLPSQILPNEELIMIGALTSICFGLLDLYSPTIVIH